MKTLVQQYWKFPTALGIFSFSLAEWYLNLQSKFELIYKKTVENEIIIQNCPSIKKREYKPTFYLPNALSQIFYSLTLESEQKIEYEKHTVICQDGGKIQLWICKTCQPKKVNKVLVVNHGHLGQIAHYYDQICIEGNLRGFQSILLVRRGMEGNSLTTPAIIRPNLTLDYEAAIKMINKKFNNPSLYAMGISMGANRLTKYVGLSKENCPFKAIVAMATPFDCKYVHYGLGSPGNNLCNKGINDGLRAIVANNYEILKKHEKEIGYDVDGCLQTKLVSDFQCLFTAPINGFECNNDAFFRDQSCYYVIKNIKVPTLFIHSLDDPICIKECIPYDEINNNENCMMILTQKGGHIEWFTGTQPERWAYKPTLEFLSYQAKKFGDE